MGLWRLRRCGCGVRWGLGGCRVRVGLRRVWFWGRGARLLNWWTFCGLGRSDRIEKITS